MRCLPCSHRTAGRVGRWPAFANFHAVASAGWLDHGEEWAQAPSTGLTTGDANTGDRKPIRRPVFVSLTYPMPPSGHNIAHRQSLMAGR